MKKRALSLFLAAVMAFGLAVPAFAAEPALEEPIPAEAEPLAEETAPAAEPQAEETARDVPAPAAEDPVYVVEVSVNGATKKYKSLDEGWEAAKAVKENGAASINVLQNCGDKSMTLTWDIKNTTLYVYTDVQDGVTVSVQDSAYLPHTPRGIMIKNGTFCLGQKPGGETGAGSLTINGDVNVIGEPSTIGPKTGAVSRLKCSGNITGTLYLRGTNDSDCMATLYSGTYGTVDVHIGGVPTRGLPAGGCCFAYTDTSYKVPRVAANDLTIHNVKIMKDPNAVAPNANTELVYGSEEALVTAGSESSTADMEYAVTTDNTEPSAGWGTAVPTAAGRDAGRYYVWWRVLPNGEYAGDKGGPIEVTIEAGLPGGYTAPTAKEGLVWNNQPQDLLEPGTVPEGGVYKFQYRLEGSEKWSKWSDEIPKSADETYGYRNRRKEYAVYWTIVDAEGKPAKQFGFPEEGVLIDVVVENALAYNAAGGYYHTLWQAVKAANTSEDPNAGIIWLEGDVSYDDYEHVGSNYVITIEKPVTLQSSQSFRSRDVQADLEIAGNGSLTVKGDMYVADVRARAGSVTVDGSRVGTLSHYTKVDGPVTFDVKSGRVTTMYAGEGVTATVGEGAEIDDVDVRGGALTVTGGKVGWLRAMSGSVALYGGTYDLVTVDEGQLKLSDLLDREHGYTFYEKYYDYYNGIWGERPVSDSDMWDDHVVNVTVKAGDYAVTVSSGGSVYNYGSFAEAMAAAQTMDSARVTLLRSTTDSVTVSGGNITLIGGGYTVSGSLTVSDGSLTVSGTGISGLNVTGGSLAVSSGAVTTLNVSGGSSLAVSGGTVGTLNVTGGSAAITGGTVTTATVSGQSEVSVSAGSVRTLNVNAGSKASISGGEIRTLTAQGGEPAIAGGAVYVEGGTVKDMTVQAASVNISGSADIGTVKVRSENWAPSMRGEVNMSGGHVGNMTASKYCYGIISGGEIDVFYNNFSYEEEINDVKLAGGTFGEVRAYAYHIEDALERILSNGYAYVDNATGNYVNPDTAPKNERSDRYLNNVTVKELGQAAVTEEPIGWFLIYDGTSQELVIEGEAYHGTMMYAMTRDSAETPTSFSEAIPQGTEIGTYYVWWKVKGDYGYLDYTPAEGVPIEVTIEKIPVEVTPPKANELTYTGTDQVLVTAGSAEGGKMWYAVTEDDEMPTDPNKWKQEDISHIVGRNAGTYFVWYKAIGDENYDNDGPWCMAVTIKKAAASVTAAPAAAGSTLFNGMEQKLLTALGGAAGGTMQYAVTDTNTAPADTAWKECDTIEDITAKDPGTYYIWYKAAGDKNHKDTEPKMIGPVTIRDAAAEMDGKYYPTLAEAVDAAVEGAVITVRQDTALAAAKTLDKAVTLRSDSAVEVTGAGFNITDGGTLTVNEYVTVYGVKAGGMDVAMDMYGNVKVTPEAVGGAVIEFLSGTDNSLRVGETIVGGEAGDKVTVTIDGSVIVPLGPAPDNIMTIDGRTYTNNGGEATTVTIRQDGSFILGNNVSWAVNPPAAGLRLAPGDRVDCTAGGEIITLEGGDDGATVDIDWNGDVTALKGHVTVRGSVTVTENGGTALQLGDVIVVVRDSSGDGISSAKVTLTAMTGDGTEGAVYEGTSVTDGIASFKDLPYGVYTVVVEYKLNERTLKVTGGLAVNRASNAQEYRFDQLLVSTDMAGDRKPAVENLDGAISDAERQAAAADGSGAVTAIDITLTSNKVEESTGTEAQKTAIQDIRQQIQQELGGSTGGADTNKVYDFVDVTIEKVTSTYGKDGGKETTKTEDVNQTASLLTLRFPISEDMWTMLTGFEENMEQHVFVYRYHDKAAERMKRVSAAVGPRADYECYYLDGSVLVIRADKFSVYAFGVTEAEVQEYTPGGGSVDDGGSSGGGIITPSPSPSPTPAPTPTPTPTPGGDEPGGDIPAPPKSGTGWSYDYDTGEWYFYKNNKLVANYWVGKIDGASQWDNNWYYVGADGKMLTGMQYLDDLHGGYGWYFLQPSDAKGEIGKMLTGYQWVGGSYGECWFSKASGSSGKCTWSELLGAPGGEGWGRIGE